MLFREKIMAQEEDGIHGTDWKCCVILRRGIRNGQGERRQKK